jgi:hypothetical protein
MMLKYHFYDYISGVMASLEILTVSCTKLFGHMIDAFDISPTSRAQTSQRGEGLACICNIRQFSSIVGWNDWLYQWIGYADWQYSRAFDITSDQIDRKTIWLKCDGLDTVANVR